MYWVPYFSVPLLCFCLVICSLVHKHYSKLWLMQQCGKLCHTLLTSYLWPSSLVGTGAFYWISLPIAILPVSDFRAWRVCQSLILSIFDYSIVLQIRSVFSGLLMTILCVNIRLFSKACYQFVVDKIELLRDAIIFLPIQT